MGILKLVIAAVAIVGLSASTAMAAPDSSPRGRFTSAADAPRGAHRPFAGSQHAVCGTPVGGTGQCLIHVLKPSGAAPAVTVTSPTGLSPAAIEGVYGYPTSSDAGAGQTIALVDAYNDPNAVSDLNAFSAQYGLPGECMGGATPPGCFNFAQVSQTGGSSLPATNTSWDLEISLDVEWAHALAPAANILLVEANTNSLANLLAAEQYASAHAGYVSNSWGSSEFSSEAASDLYFAQPGVSYFAASGDSASQLLWPSASPNVTSVGGTSLGFTSGGTLAQESAWSSGGGGCSRYETASSSQKLGSVNCSGKRGTPDLSVDADPNSGLSVYDTVTYQSQNGWWTVGGTSASTAEVAAVAAVAHDVMSQSFVYANPANIPFRDIITGSNGHSAVTGYDLATGLGSWSKTPGAATALAATTGSGGVTVNWSAPSGPTATQYNVWRGTSPGQETTDVASVSGSTTYTDASATGSATYYYEIQAVNAAGVGPFSNEAIAAPPSVSPVASFNTSCSGATCKFTSTSTDSQGTINAWAWNGDNGATGNSSSFSDTYSAAATYTVSLTVTNTAGQSSVPATRQVTCKLSGSGKRRSLTCS